MQKLWDFLLVLFLRYGLIASAVLPLKYEEIMSIWYISYFLHLSHLLVTWGQLNLCEFIHLLMLKLALEFRTQMDSKCSYNSIKNSMLHRLMDCDRKSWHIRTMCFDVKTSAELTYANWFQVEVIQQLCRIKLRPLLDLQWH